MGLEVVWYISIGGVDRAETLKIYISYQVQVLQESGEIPKPTETSSGVAVNRSSLISLT